MSTSKPNSIDSEYGADAAVHGVPTLNRENTTHVENLYEEGTLDPVYEAKTRMLNAAIMDIGMGKYQYLLFVVAGFGWFADSVWPLITGLILAPVIAEFHFSGPFLSLAANVGLLVGAVFWGLGCDIWGRRWSFNITLLIAGVFGLAAGGSPNFVTLASLVAALGTGVGGNMPVDSAVFLDFVPASHQYLLTVMSVFWSLGQLLVSLLAWPFIANFSCALNAPTCSRSENMGWRYLLFTLGAMTLVLWAVRFFVFELLESPRFLVGVGKDEEAVQVIRRIAEINGGKTDLTVEELRSVGVMGKGKKGEGEGATSRNLLTETSAYTAEHVKALFATKKMAWSTSLLISLWGIIGLASTLYNSFLPYLLASRGAKFGDATLNITYRNQVILSLIGVPAAFLAGWAVEVPVIGRKGTLAISSGLTGVFLFASTTARSSNALLGWNCGYVFNSNIMYGVLYAISPEIFPAKDRGTGNGLVSTATRVFGVIAPIIALYADLTTAVPVYIAGALVIMAGGVALLLPYEPRGKASM
ncbi:MFS general substrate transporter [Crucibulum laeve]|uniref:MFS general substrate transporter n=1 Tax=Crucibulum laeve TaxID=68775 RepID=A0A5C3LJC0_9AGAR|nr:MFS general substrate transporter [Crucibulum laeve]